jgi:hypothetical protein
MIFEGRNYKEGDRCKFSHAPHVLRHFWKLIKKLLASKFSPPDKIPAIQRIPASAVTEAGGELMYKVANQG